MQLECGPLHGVNQRIIHQQFQPLGNINGDWFVRFAETGYRESAAKEGKRP
jgi:hypothetical protein